MSVALTINGVVYNYPEEGDTSWGVNATDWATAVTGGMLQKSGGSFFLTAEVDFGGTYGPKSVYFKSRTPNPSTTGVVRLANTDAVAWRNAGNSADLPLTVGADDLLDFNGVTLVDETTAQTLENKTLGTGTVFTGDIGALDALATTGVAVRTGSETWATRTITGTANQVTMTNGDGVAGNPTVAIASNAVLPGSEGIVLPSGSTGQRSGTPTVGTIRYNTTLGRTETFDGSGWSSVEEGTVTSVDVVQPAAGITATGGPITSSGSITLALADDLAAVEGIAGTGLATRTASNTWTTRTITGTAGRVVLTNGDGVAGNPTIDLNASGATPGTYKSVTVDTYGRVTAGTNPTTLAGYGITDAQPLDTDLTALAGLATTGLLARTGSGTAAARTITGTTNEITVSNGNGVSANPTIGLSANPVMTGTASVTVPAGTTAQRPGSPANGMIRYNTTDSKFEAYEASNWVDMIGGSGGGTNQIKLPVTAATTANITLAGDGQTIDGIAWSGVFRFLVKNQTNATENGIYLSSGGVGAWTRVSDADTSGEFEPGFLVYVMSGLTQNDTFWFFNFDDSVFPFTLGVSNVTFTALTSGSAAGGSNTQVQFNSSGSFAGDAGLTYNSGTDVLTVAGGISSTSGGFTTSSGNITSTSGNISTTSGEVRGPVFRTTETTAPATPAAGFGYLYEKTDGLIYFKNDAGTEFDLTSGGGGGGSLFFVDDGTTPTITPTVTSSIDGLAIGSGAVAVTGSAAIAIGNSRAAGVDSIAIQIGNNTSTYGAKGNNSIAMGLLAEASSDWSIAIGEEARVTTTLSINSTIVGGYQNTINGGGNVNTIVGGDGNLISSSSVYNGIFSGQSCTISDAFTSSVVGGFQNTMNNASMGGSVILGGENSSLTTSGANIGLLAVYDTVVTGTSSDVACLGGGDMNVGLNGVVSDCVSMGWASAPITWTSLTIGSGSSAVTGDRQSGIIAYQTDTTNATPTEVRTNGPFGTPVANQFLLLPNNTTLVFKALVVARRTDVDGENAAYELTGCIKRDANAASTSLVGTVTKTVIAEDTGATSWDVNATADTTNGRLAITVTGEAAKTIGWEAKIDFAMVQG